MNGPNPRGPERPHLQVTDSHKSALELQKSECPLSVVSVKKYIDEYTKSYETQKRAVLEKQQQMAAEREEQAIEDPYLVFYDAAPDSAEWTATKRENAPEDLRRTRQWASWKRRTQIHIPNHLRTPRRGSRWAQSQSPTPCET